MDDKTSSDVLAIIAKMFLEPLPPPFTSNWRMSPGNGMQFYYDGKEYSPAMWADPLVPYRMKCGTKDYGNTNDEMPAIYVLVNHRQQTVPTKCKLSAMGQQIENIMKQDIRQIWEVDISLEMWSMATILKGYNTSTLLEEAAILRLMMLQLLTIDPVELVYTSSAINEMALNMHVKPSDVTSSWSPALPISDKEQIGTSLETSTLYFRTIDEFAAIITSPLMYQLQTKDGKEISYMETVYIPVKLCWTERSWLMPYILAFTTTRWWNHAYTVDVTYTNSMDSKIDDMTMKGRFMPKSSLVYISGGYQRICLVIVDATRESLPEDYTFNLCKGIFATRLGNFDFARQVHCYLKRAKDPNDSIKIIEPCDVSDALRYMSDMYCTRKEFMLLQLKASILATSRFNGFGVCPGPLIPQDNEIPRDQIFGPAQFNLKSPMSIDDYILPDLLDETIESLQQRLYCHQMWRCDPLGYFAYSKAKILQDQDHHPCLYVQNMCVQYQATTCFTIERIARVCGLLTLERSLTLRVNPLYFLNTFQSYGSLMLGLTNWAFVDLGYTMFQLNQLGAYLDRHADIYSLWPFLTQGFLTNQKGCSGNRSIDSIEFYQACGWIMNWSSVKSNINPKWLDCHYSWNVPWWYVAAIARKFGCNFEVKSPSNYHLVDMIPSHDMIGWLITKKEGHQYDLSILASTFDYKKQNILTPSSNRYSVEYNLLSWYPNGILDMKKHYFDSNTGLTKLPKPNRVLELNVVVFPSGICQYPRAFVSEGLPIYKPDMANSLYFTDNFISTYTLQNGNVVVKRSYSNEGELNATRRDCYAMVASAVLSLNLEDNTVKDTERIKCNQELIASFKFKTSPFWEDRNITHCIECYSKK